MMKKFISCLPDEAFLSKINIPGTHDSCTAFCALENMSRCQSLTVNQQLEAGIRLFDIRLHKKGQEFYLVHALADCFTDSTKQKRLTFGEVLESFRNFIMDNPEEVLIVSVKQDRGIMSRKFFPAFYNKYIKENQGEWFLKNEDPTLSQCRGKMVLMRRCKVKRKFGKEHEAGLDFSIWKDQDGKRKTHPLPVILNKNTVAMVQDRYGLPADVKWKDCALSFLEYADSVIEKNQFALHFFSTAHREQGKTLFETAEKVNGEFMKYELKKNGAQGWMFFDFPEKELIDKVITSNFEIYKEKVK